MTADLDRRRHTRFDINLPGLLSASGAAMRRCVMHDFCVGGLLVEITDDSAPAVVGEQVRVDVKLTLRSGVRPLAISAGVVWVRGAYLGLAFDRESPEWVQLLKQHQASSMSSGAEPDIGQGGEARVRARLRHSAKALLPGLLRELLINANERLLTVADQVSSNSQQAQLFSDLNALDRLRKTDQLFNAVLAACDGAAVAVAEDESGRALSLIDPDEFERWLEASRAATLLERRFGETVTKLASRLAMLHGADGPQDLHAPFEPQHFTDAVKQVASEIGVASETRAALFDATTQVLGEQLPAFYAELNAVLDSLDVPQAAERAYRVITAPRTASAEFVPQAEVPPVDAAIPAATTAVANLGGAAAGATPVGTAPMVQLDPLVLDKARGMLRTQRVAQADQLLAEVLELPAMTESLQGWLAQLDAPLKQQASAEPGLFNDAGNSLRAIIDALGHLQMFRPSPDAPAETDELRRQIDELLAPLSAGDASGDALDAAADRIGSLTQRQSLRYQQNVERVVEASEGRERVRQSRARVIRTLNERYASREVPEVLLELLETGWRSVLELALLRDLDSEHQLQHRFDLLDGLVAKLGGQAVDTRSAELPNESLLESIGGELAEAAFDPFRVAAVEKRLSRELLDAKAWPARLVRFAPLPEDEDAAGELDRPAAIAQDAWAAILEQCEAVRVGDRLRFKRVAKGQPAELRVAWIREDRGLFTLVDHRGLRVREINRPDLALGLYRREIHLERIDGAPLSERAADTILSRMERRLAHQASHDSLTGLINRNQFKAALEQQLRRARGSGVMLWLDIDQFRLINDMHGYDAGDRLLVSVARLLEQAQGANVLAHIGGDRFGMLLLDAGTRDALERAEGIRKKVIDMPFSLATQSLSISVSIGMVALDAPDNASVSGLMQAADDALSAAKGEGGNRVFTYDEQDPVIQRHRASVHWVAQVDDALENGSLHLRCQAIVPVLPDAGLAPHYEVLLGVANSDRQNLPIAEFIDAAERYNRMRAVDRWITRTVIEWIAAHRADMARLHGFAVNLSGQTASDPAFVDYVRQAFQKTGIDPSWLSFEVTETAAVADLSTSAGIVQDLKALGCRVALDDFGSGLASYSYLKELPVDWLKIDGAFVSKIAVDSGDYAVVKSINEIGHFLGKQTIAEYVADETILRLVAEIGVDYAQGFAIAQPILMDDLILPAEAKRA